MSDLSERLLAHAEAEQYEALNRGREAMELVRRKLPYDAGWEAFLAFQSAGRYLDLREAADLLDRGVAVGDTMRVSVELIGEFRTFPGQHSLLTRVVGVETEHDGAKLLILQNAEARP